MNIFEIIFNNIKSLKINIEVNGHKINKSKKQE